MRNLGMTYCNSFNPDYYIFYSFRIPGSGARFFACRNTG
jgi:hypothetical protein